MTRKGLFVTRGPLPLVTCPRCRVSLSSATGLSLDQPSMPSDGDLTICDACHAWLAFVVSPAGFRLRLATAAEIAAIEPDLRAIAEQGAALGRPGGRAS